MSTPDGHGTIVAGFDGTDAARSAADWACREALWSGHRLLLVLADEPYEPAVIYGMGHLASWDGIAPHAHDAEQLAVLTGECRARAPGLDVDMMIRAGPPARVLAQVADEVDADLIVLGRTSLGALVRIMFGSTATELLRATSRPVVVVRDEEPPDARSGPVVVAVDSPSACSPALEFAFAFAARHGAPLHAIHANPAGPHLLPRRGTGRSATSDELTDTFLGTWPQRHPHVPVWTEAVDDHPTPVLLNRSRGAQLLVVGHGAQGPLHRVLHGSLSHTALRHAPCPVAVLPERQGVHRHRAHVQE